MSNIDQRIVEMQFNNSRFEKNAKQSMSTLDKLKEKLNFKSSTKELEDFQSAADSFNLAHIASALDAIGDKFTLMGNLGQQAMQRISNAAITMGTNLVKSISVDQIGAGFSKYEEETNTVQTLLASLKPKGKTKDDIYAGLDLLAQYSDETSYSYTQMASAVSNFVNAGLDFDDSIEAMQGIANVAAKAGVSIQDAQIAFRNFSDAAGKGSFKREDWKSIQLIHMDAEWYKESLLETAAELGKLQKDENGAYWYDNGKKGKAKKRQQVTATNFAEFLQYGIIDKDVIMKNSLKWAEDEEAFAAAQNAKTYTDVIDAVKDAVSTSWKTSFRTIFGDVDEAIALFTPMANKIIEYTSMIGEARNTILSKWKDSGGRDSMIETLSNVWDSFNYFTDQFKYAVFDVFKPSWDEMEAMAAEGGFLDYLGKRLANVTENIKNATQKFNEWLNGRNSVDGLLRVGNIRQIFDGILSVVNIAKMAIGGFFRFLGNIFDQLKPTFDSVLSLLGYIGHDILGLNDDLKNNKGFEKLADSLAGMFKPITDRLPKVIGKIKEFYDRLKTLWNTDKKFVNFRKAVQRVFDSFVKFVPNAIESIINFGKGIVETVKNSDEWKALVQNYNKYIKPVVSSLQRTADKVTRLLGDFFSMDTSNESTMWGKLKKRFSVFNNLGPWMAEEWSHLKTTFPILQQVEDWWNTNEIVGAIRNIFGKITEAIDTFMSTDTSSETSLVGKLKMRFEAMWASIGPMFDEYYGKLKEKFPIIQQIEDFITQIFGGGGKDTKDAAKDGAENAQEGEETMGLFEKLWAKIQEFAGKIEPGKLVGLAAAIGVLVWVYKKVKTLLGWAGLGEKVGEAIETFTETINQVKKTLKNQNTESKVRSLLGVAASIWLLGDTLTKVAKLSWEEIARGLTGMAGLFAEEGAFMVVMGALSKKGVIDGNGVSSLKLIGTAVAMWLLGKALKDVSALDWPQIATGLTSMAGLFVETGAFTILVNRFGSTSLFQKKGTGALSMIATAVSMMILGKTLKSLSQMTWDEIGRGLTAMAGLFVETGAFTVLVNRLGRTSIFEKKGANSATMLSTAKMIKSLADTLKSLSDMTWDEIGRGLTAMAGLFIESGAFMILVNRLGSPGNILQKSGTSGILSTTVSIMLLANKLKDLGTMSWDEIGRGLAAMAGLFVEEGAFMTIIGFLSKKNLINAGSVNATTGLLAGGIGRMGDAMAKLGQLSVRQIVKGAIALAAIEVLLGLYVGLTSKIKKVKITSAIGMAVMAGAIWIMAQAFVPLASIPEDQLLTGIYAMGAICVALGVFVFAMSKVNSKISTVLGIIVSAIALAALMVAFAFALTLIKDVDPALILAFGVAMVLISVAMAALAKAIEVLSKINFGAAVKAIGIIAIATLLIGGVVILLASLAGMAMEGVGANIAMVGSYLSLYSEMIADVDFARIRESITVLKEIALAFVEIGAKDYGNLETFKTNLSRMGASIKLFGMNTADINTEQLKTVTAALKDMAMDLSGFPEVGDVGTSIGNIGGAIKLYSESLNGVDLSQAPDTSSIKTVFETLRSAIPNDENLTEVAGFASEGKGDEMTNFAIGLTNIATAVSSFSESAKDLDFTNMQSAIDALDSIAKLGDHFGTTTVEATGAFGAFGLKVTEEKGNLTTFSEDVTLLGTSLEAFGTNISKVKVEDLKSGVGVLEQIAALNEKLPKDGGISQWLTGSVSLTRFAAQLKLLGEGAKDFNDSIFGGEHEFDAGKVKVAGEALAAIADVNSKLPKTGGISSWFSGNQDLGNFANNLKQLGGGVKEFADGLGTTKINQNVTDGIGVINRLASIQIRLGSVETWYDLSTFGNYISSLATSAQSANSTLSGITWADTTTFENFINAMADVQVKLGGTEYKKNLRQLGEDLKGFYENVYSFNTSFMNGDNGKLNKVTESVKGIFDSLNTFLANTEANGEYTKTGENIIASLAEGIGDENSKIKVGNKMTEIVNHICTLVKDSEHAFYNVGTWIPAGLGRGIWDNRYAAINKAVDVMKASITAAEKAGGIESPSKEFARLGMYSDLGLAKGLRDYIPVVTAASKDVTDDAIRTVLDSMNDIQNLPLEDMDISPAIRPVLDTSDLRGSAGIINGLLGDTTRGIGFNTKALEAKAQILNDNYTPDIVAIGTKVQEMNDKLSELSEAMTKMKIVLNNGALVGGIASEMDKQLGMRGRRAERGM